MSLNTTLNKDIAFGKNMVSDLTHAQTAAGDMARRKRMEESLGRRYGSRVADAKRRGPGGPGGRHGGAGHGDRSKPKDIKKTFGYILSYVFKEKPRLRWVLVRQ